VIVLDTNVLSELLRPSPSPIVLAWARSQDAQAIFTTAVCEAELLFGVAAMAEGRRRTALAQAVEAILGTILGGRVLPFDRAAARTYGLLAADCRRSGRPVGVADLQIAAIARTRNATAVATRNIQHFLGCGLPLIDPWSAPDVPGSESK
jgi:predicted nucleic acid-binding protein